MSVPVASLVPFTSEGTYRDAVGEEVITWRILPRPGTVDRPPGFEVRTTIRGVHFWDDDFDALEPFDLTAATLRGLPLDRWNYLQDCELSGSLPCAFEKAGERIDAQVEFDLDLRNGKTVLRLRCRFGDEVAEVVDGEFEDAMLKLDRALPEGLRVASCVTCLYSDYAPGGHGLTGMRCHREAKEQYLAVRVKADYWSVPVTEEVMETHRCAEWTRRIPGTGYRG